MSPAIAASMAASPPTGRARALVSWLRPLGVGFLVMVCGLVFWSVAPTAVGWTSAVVESGSMSPKLEAGDVVVFAPAPAREAKIGQVVLVRDPARPGHLLSRRLVGRDRQGRLLTKGDANMSRDSTPVPPRSLVGIGRLDVPRIGSPLVWMRNGAYPRLLASALALLLAMALVVAGEPSGSGRRRAWRPRRNPFVPDVGYGSFGSRGAVLGDWVAGVRDGARTAAPWATAVLAVAALVLGPTAISVVPRASAAFAGTTRNPSNAFAAASTFPDYRAVIAADSPLFYHRLEETGSTGSAGAIADSSGNSKPGQLIDGGQILAGQTGALTQANAAVTFPGSSTSTIASSASVTAPGVYSIELFLKTTTTTGGFLMGFSAARSTASAAADRLLYMTNSGTLVFGNDTGGSKQTITSSSAYNDGAFHHVVATVGAGGATLYVDGASVGTIAGLTSNTNSFTGYWRFGDGYLNLWTSRPTSDAFAGTIDEAAVYTTELSSARVGAHYSARTSTTSAYASAVAADSPYLYYRLADTGGPSASVADSSANNHAGSFNYSPWTPLGVAGALKGSLSSTTAVTFTGSGGSRGYNPQSYSPPSTFTIETWFKTTTTNGGGLINFGDQTTAVSSNYDRMIYMTNAGLLIFGVYPGSTKIVSSTAAYNDGAWHYVAATFGSAGQFLYVDGALVASDTASTTAQSYTGYWHFGGDRVDSWPSQPSSFFFAGSMDEIAVYGTQLSANRIRTHYYANR